MLCNIQHTWYWVPWCSWPWTGGILVCPCFCQTFAVGWLPTLQKGEGMWYYKRGSTGMSEYPPHLSPFQGDHHFFSAYNTNNVGNWNTVTNKFGCVGATRCSEQRRMLSALSVHGPGPLPVVRSCYLHSLCSPELHVAHSPYLRCFSCEVLPNPQLTWGK